MEQLERGSLRTDDSAIEHIPLQLIIILVVLAISLPIVVMGWMSFDRAQVESRVQSELTTLSTRIGSICNNGNGNANKLPLDLRGGTFTKLEYVEVGGAILGDSDRLITWKMEGGSVRHIIIENGARASVGGNESLHLGSGSYTVHYECKVFQGEEYADLSIL